MPCDTLYSRPPSKCYVCYPKESDITCTLLSATNPTAGVTEFVTLLSRPVAEKWLKAYITCMKKCPASLDDLKNWMRDSMTKVLDDSSFANSKFVCGNGRCEMTSSTCLLENGPPPCSLTRRSC